MFSNANHIEFHLINAVRKNLIEFNFVIRIVYEGEINRRKISIVIQRIYNCLYCKFSRSVAGCIVMVVSRICYANHIARYFCEEPAMAPNDDDIPELRFSFRICFPV